MAIIAGKISPAEGQRVRTTLDPRVGYRIRQSALRGGGPWILVADRVSDALAELQGGQPTVGTEYSCHLGVKTGANHLFLNPPEDLEPEVLRWAIRGRDLSPFSYQSRTRLLWTHDPAGRPLRELPPRAAAYLMTHHAELQRRKDFQGGVPWMVFRAGPATARYRVVWADLARELTATALTTTDDLARIPLNSCYVAPAGTATHAERLAAWLNSSWLRVAARLTAVPAASGFSRYNARTVSQLPLPASVLSDSRLSRIRRDGQSGNLRQEELDDIAARHLGLSTAAQNALLSLGRNRSPGRR
jgi:hypothetical protein